MARHLLNTLKCVQATGRLVSNKDRSNKVAYDKGSDVLR